MTGKKAIKNTPDKNGRDRENKMDRKDVQNIVKRPIANKSGSRSGGAGKKGGKK